MDTVSNNLTSICCKSGDSVQVELNEIYPKQRIVGQTERLYQVPSKPAFRVKVTKHLHGSIHVINDCVQPRGDRACCFVGLAAFSELNLTMSASKLDRTGTVVPKARGLTYFFADPSIDTRITFAAAIDAGYLTVT